MSTAASPNPPAAAVIRTTSFCCTLALLARPNIAVP